MELRFQIAGIPVKVQSGFWVMSALLGWGTGNIRTVLVWIACVFFGVLCHEFGHALAARAFGGRSEIILYAMGGLTSTRAEVPMGRARQVAISLAGPFAGFLLGGLVLIASMVLLPGQGSILERLLSRPHDARLSSIAIEYLLWINLGWGLVNLLPVLPFDGGHVAQHVLGEGEAGWSRAAWLTLVIGPSVAIVCFVTGWRWAGLLFAFSSVQTVRDLIARRNYRADQKLGLHERMAAANAAMDAGDLQAVVLDSSEIVARAHAPELKRNASHVLAMAYLRLQQPQKALQVLEALPPGHADPVTIGLCLLETGKTEEAARNFQLALEHGDEGARELLVTALELSGDSKRAQEVRSAGRNQSSSTSNDRDT